MDKHYAEQAAVRQSEKESKEREYQLKLAELDINSSVAMGQLRIEKEKLRIDAENEKLRIDAENEKRRMDHEYQMHKLDLKHQRYLNCLLQ